MENVCFELFLLSTPFVECLIFFCRLYASLKQRMKHLMLCSSLVKNLAKYQ